MRSILKAIRRWWRRQWCEHSGYESQLAFDVNMAARGWKGSYKFYKCPDCGACTHYTPLGVRKMSSAERRHYLETGKML
jgi:hypothetical protein